MLPDLLQFSFIVIFFTYSNIFSKIPLITYVAVVMLLNLRLTFDRPLFLNEQDTLEITLRKIDCNLGENTNSYVISSTRTSLHSLLITQKFLMHPLNTLQQLKDLVDSCFNIQFNFFPCEILILLKKSFFTKQEEIEIAKTILKKSKRGILSLIDLQKRQFLKLLLLSERLLKGCKSLLRGQF